MENSVDALLRLNVDLAFFLKKLLNLNKFLVQIITGKYDNHLGMKNNFILLGSFEKTLAFDYLSGVLDSEVKELKDDFHTLQVAHQKISFHGSSRELNSVEEEKLNDSEAYLKQSQDIVLIIKMQSDKMQEAISSSRHDNWENGKYLEYSVNGLILKANTDSPIGKQQRDILRMLNESLTRELNLEKKISELKQNEEDLLLKLQLTEKVASSMEEASMFVSGRFLEAELSAELFMGISKDLLGGIQSIESDLNRSIQREDDLKSNPHDCMEQLKTCKNDLPVLESSNEELHEEDDNAELISLRKKVKTLEEHLNESTLQLNEAEDVTKKSISRAEIRAESAEARVSILTEVNLELREELGFIKDSKSMANVGLLEKKLRELEDQSFQAQASSEASQKQQILLYSAILEMETLIGDLKSKLSIAESKAEYIGIKARHLLDLVKRVAFERGFIQNKLRSVLKENKYLMEKLKDYSSNDSSHTNHDCDSNCGITSGETSLAESSTEFIKVIEVSSESEEMCSSSTDNGSIWRSLKKAVVLWLIIVMISYLFIFRWFNFMFD